MTPGLYLSPLPPSRIAKMYIIVYRSTFSSVIISNTDCEWRYDEGA